MSRRMKVALGLGSIMFGLIAAYFISSAIQTPTSIYSGGGYVANLELMHMQSLNMAQGIGAAIVSAILVVGAAIVSAIRPD